MLQTGTGSFIFQSRPNHILQHTARLQRPQRKTVGIQRKIPLQIRHNILIFKKQNRSIPLGKRSNLFFRCGKFIRRHNLLQRFFDNFPQALMIFLKQNNHPSRLRIKSRRTIFNHMVNQRYDLFLRNSLMIPQTINRTPVLNCFVKIIFHISRLFFKIKLYIKVLVI